MKIKKFLLFFSLITAGGINLYAGEPVTVIGNTHWPIEAARFVKQYGLMYENFIFNKSSQLMLQFNLSQQQVAAISKKLLGTSNPIADKAVDLFSNCVNNITGKIGLHFQLPNLGKICGQDITQMLVDAVRDDVYGLHDKIEAWLLNPDTWRKTIDFVPNNEKDKESYSSLLAYSVCLETNPKPKGYVSVNVGDKTIRVYQDYCIIPDSSGKMVTIPRTYTGAEKYCNHIDFNAKDDIKLIACQQMLGASSSNSLIGLSTKASNGNILLLGNKIGQSTQVKELYGQMANNMKRIEKNSARLTRQDLKVYNVVYNNLLNSAFFKYNSEGYNGILKNYVRNTVNVNDAYTYPVTLPYVDTEYLRPIRVKNSGTEGFTLTSKLMGQKQGNRPLVMSIGIPIFTNNKDLLLAVEQGKLNNYDQTLDKIKTFYEKVSGNYNSQTSNFLENMKLRNILSRVKENENNQVIFNYAALSRLGYLESILAYKSVNGPNGGNAAKYIGIANLLGGILYQLHLINLQLYAYHKADAQSEYYKWLYLKERLLDIQKDLEEFKIENSVFLQRILQK